MNQDLQSIRDTLFSLQNEIDELKLSYREIHTHHADTLSSLKNCHAARIRLRATRC